MTLHHYPRAYARQVITNDNGWVIESGGPLSSQLTDGSYTRAARAWQNAWHRLCSECARRHAVETDEYEALS